MSGKGFETMGAYTLSASPEEMRALAAALARENNERYRFDRAVDKYIRTEDSTRLQQEVKLSMWGMFMRLIQRPVVRDELWAVKQEEAQRNAK